MVDVSGVPTSSVRSNEEANKSMLLYGCAYELCNVMQNLKLCSGCQDTWYCSEDHQKKHWRTHRSKCKVQMAQSSREVWHISSQGRLTTFPGVVGGLRRNGNVGLWPDSNGRPTPLPSPNVFIPRVVPSDYTRYNVAGSDRGRVYVANHTYFPRDGRPQPEEGSTQLEEESSRPHSIIDSKMKVSPMPVPRPQNVPQSVNQNITTSPNDAVKFQPNFESDPIVDQDTDKFSECIKRSSSYPLSPSSEVERESNATSAHENDHGKTNKNTGHGGETACTFTLGAESTETSSPSIISSRNNSKVNESPVISNSLIDYVAQWMQTYGICVLDKFLSEEQGLRILEEIKVLYSKGKFKAGQLVRGRGGESSKEIRGDLITWTDGTESECISIGHLISEMDSIVMACQGKLPGINISGRTKAMLACYPGNGTHYVKHVDNPSRDGRRITCIYYLNRNWDSKKNGGLLRIYPQGQDIVANIEPLFNRLLLFWSDRRNPHEVFPAYATRYAVTVWYFDEEERSKAKISS